MKLAGRLFRRGAKDRDAYDYEGDPNDLDDFDDSRRLDLESMTLDDLDVPGRERASVLGRDDLDGPARSGRKVRPVFIVALVAVILLVVAVQGYSVLFGGPSDGEVPVVRAADDPVKVKPETPGGMEVPYQDRLVMNQPAEGAEGTQVERLLPPPEAPQPPQAAEKRPLTAKEIVELTARMAEAEGRNRETAASPAAEAPPEAPPSVIADPEPEARPAPAADAGTAQPSAAEVVAAKPPAPQQQAALPAPTAKPSDGRFFIQLLSLTSKEGTAASWAKLQKAHPEQLGGSGLFVQEAQVSGRTYYRVQAGRFASREAANAVCGQLKARKQDCLVLER